VLSSSCTEELVPNTARYGVIFTRRRVLCVCVVVFGSFIMAAPAAEEHTTAGRFEFELPTAQTNTHNQALPKTAQPDPNKHNQELTKTTHNSNKHKRRGKKEQKHSHTNTNSQTIHSSLLKHHGRTKQTHTEYSEDTDHIFYLLDGPQIQNCLSAFEQLSSLTDTKIDEAKVCVCLSVCAPVRVVACTHSRESLTNTHPGFPLCYR